MAPQPMLDAQAAGAITMRFAQLLVRLRFAIVALWAALVVAAVVLLPTISQASRDRIDGFVPPKSATVQTEIRAARTFGFPLTSRTAIVQRDPEGLSARVQLDAVNRAVAITRGEYADEYLVRGALPVLNTFGVFPGARENGTTIVTYLFTPPKAGFSQRLDAAQDIIAATSQPDDATIGVTGSVPARVEQARIVKESLPLIELATVGAILLITGLVFRSVVAPVVTILIGGVALVITTRVAPVLAGAAGVAVPGELEPLYVALVLGVVTDYVIFFLSGFRIQLSRTPDRVLAVERATASVAPIVVVAGLTVAAGTAALLVARSELFKAFGPGMALAVLVGMVVSVSLTPALMAILGRYVLWPSIPAPWVAPSAGTAGQRDDPPGAPRSRRLFELLTRRRPAAVVLVACVGVLVVAALPLRDLQLGLGFVPSLPKKSEVSVAADAARKGFADGILSPTLLLVEGQGVGRRRQALARLGQLLESQPGVAGVVGPGLLPRELEEPGVVISSDRAAARYMLILDDQPLGAAAINTMSRLREAVPALAERAGVGTVRTSFGGDTSLAEEIVSGTTRDLARISVAALIANLLMLVVFLAALVAPLYLLASSVLALAASLGLTTFVFQTLLGHDGLTFYVPFAAAVLLLSLGSDYNIFGVGQVWEEARSRPIREAIRHAMPQSTKAITSAGVVLAASFGLLALVPLDPFRQLAFAMSVGILLDAVVVRSLLVPALLTLVGPVSQWPGSLIPPPVRRALSRAQRKSSAFLADEHRSVSERSPVER